MSTHRLHLSLVEQRAVKLARLAARVRSAERKPRRAVASDMGLGRTLQTIAVLTDRTRRGGDRPHLVVCPTSVVSNWERELARFAPRLAVVRHHGPDRPSDPAGSPAGSVALTSYGLVRRHADLLTAVDWDTVVLDEAQQVKNHAAQAAKAVRRLLAQVRLALTGTPVEKPAERAVVDHGLRQPGVCSTPRTARSRRRADGRRLATADDGADGDGGPDRLLTELRARGSASARSLAEALGVEPRDVRTGFARYASVGGSPGAPAMAARRAIRRSQGGFPPRRGRRR